MSEAEALAANVTSRRSVTIEIKNISGSYIFTDPQIYMESGHCQTPPGPKILAQATETSNFCKTSAKTSGAVGLLAYNMMRKGRNSVSDGKLVIMFSVPYDRTCYKNWDAVGIFDKDTKVDEDLYKKIYYDKNQDKFVRKEANGSAIIYEGDSLDIMAGMSPLGNSIMKVEIWDKLFSACKSQNTY